LRGVILTFSHLRWDFVYQRPQQLLSRFAARHNARVLFVEEPVRSAGERWEASEAEPNVIVLRPHTPVAAPGFSDEQMPALRRLLAELAGREDLGGCCAWFYTPMAVPLLAGLKPRVVVYDAMDELSGFLNAPPQLLEREEELFALADVVFTGGPSLYRAKRGRHANVHCFPSSVDAAHFGRARTRLEDPPDQAGIAHPRLGFFGVIDERMDLALLDEAARSRPEWQFVMVGPVVKIEEASLPRRPNLHYLGQKQYAELPAYVSNWEACLLPFARNEATRFISPTKTLEYMAAGKPIAGTPIVDVIEPYGEIVYAGATPREFVEACERALRAPDQEREERAGRARAVLANTSWDATADRMADLVARAQRRAKAPARRKPIVVAGAGPTGLSAAYHAGRDALLLEQADRVGGWCRSIAVNGFTFDYAGHIMFSGDEYVHRLYRILLGGNMHWQDREAWVYSKGVYTRYPFQGSLYGLPPEVIKECLTGAIEARFGPLHGPAQPRKANGNGPQCAPGEIRDCCADGILESEAALARMQEEPRNFEEFIYKVWGAGIAKHFAIPYNRKLWTVPLAEMETSWLGGRVPLPDLEEMIEGALKPAPKPMGPNARFGYPLRGGFQALMDAFLPLLEGELRLKARVARVWPRRRALELADGTELEYEHLISTMPLPVLIAMMGDEAPPKVRAAAAALRHISVRCVHLGVGRPNLTAKHWIYYPEDTVFHRIFVQGNASPHCNPPGGFGLTCEITYSPWKPLPAEGDELVRRCIEDCVRTGMMRPEDPILAAAQCDLPHAYVVYDHARARNVAVIRKWIEQQGILLAGRYSEWEYYNSDHAFIAGKKAVEQIRSGIESPPLPYGAGQALSLRPG
jgi:UDP-galactopyranose mutase